MPYLFASESKYGYVKITFSVSAHSSGLLNYDTIYLNFAPPSANPDVLNNVSARSPPICCARRGYISPASAPTRSVTWGGAKNSMAIRDILESM